MGGAMTSLHAPLTRRGRALRIGPAFTPDDTRPLQEVLLIALRAGEDRLTRRAQDERDIEALHIIRAAIQRAQQ
jgi:hypothetical protein